MVFVDTDRSSAKSELFRPDFIKTINLYSVLLNLYSRAISFILGFNSFSSDKKRSRFPVVLNEDLLEVLSSFGHPC